MADKGPDEMYCESCGEVIKKEAEICPHCGVRNKSNTGTTSSGSGRSENVHDEGMFVFPLKYPISPGLMPIIIGAVMTLLGFLILPMVILYGYTYRIGRAAARGDDVAPGFDDWGGLLKDGFLMIIAFLPFGIAMVLILGLMFGASAAIDNNAVSLLIILFALLLYFVAGYFGGAIIPALMATGSVKGAYSGGRFLKMSLSKDYVIGLVFLLVLNVVVQTAVSIVATILFFTLIGIIIAIPLYIAMVPYISYLTGSLWGYVIWDSDSSKFPDVADDAQLGLEF